MKKLWRLLQNEYSKQFRKISVVVIAALILAISFAAPIIKDALWKSSVYQYNPITSEIESLDWQISSLEQDLKDEGLANNAKVNELNIKYLQERKELLEFAQSCNVGSYDDWRTDSVMGLDPVLRSKLTYQAVLDGYLQADITNALSPEFDVGEAEKLSPDELKSLVAEQEKALDKGRGIIQNNNYKIYVQTLKQQQLDQISELESQKKSFEEALAENKGDQQAAARISSIESKIQTARDLADLYEYRIKNDIPLNREDWRSVTLYSIADNLMVANDPPMSEEDFTMQYSWRIAEGFTYQDYLEQTRSQQLGALDNIQIYKHSLEVGKPEYKQAVDAAATRRNALDAPSMLVLTTLFCVMIASGIVSSEHSKGTVRLLLMRPVKRWKILLSKYAMVLSLGFGMALLSTLLYLAGNMITYGAADLANPMYTIVNGTVVESSFLLFLLRDVSFVFISVVFAISLAFAASTIFKNTALSVIFGVVTCFASTPILLIAGQLKLKWVMYTPFPYLSLSGYTTSGGMASMIAEQFNMTAHPVLGAWWLVGLSAVLVFLAFLTFGKRDVKN